MNNPFQLFQAMRNPQQFLQQMAGNSQAMSNPILKNAMDMANKGDTKGVEQLARNLCKEKGINSDGRSVEDMGMKSESRYDRARRSYSETKDMHKANTKEDNDANMRGLESLLAVIDEDLKEIMPGLSASEKTMMKTKMTNWVQRI